MRFSPRARRATATTSCEVGPSGLSTRRTPSTGVISGGVAARLAAGRLVDLPQHPLDPVSLFEGVVEGEAHGRRIAEMEVLEQDPLDEAGGAPERLETALARV